MTTTVIDDGVRLEGGIRYAPVPGFPGYWVGETGVLSSTRQSGSFEERREMRCRLVSRSDGRLCRREYRMLKKGRHVCWTAAECVLTAFGLPRPAGHTPLHKNLDTLDDRLENLTWVTLGEYQRLMRTRATGRTRSGVLTTTDVHKIRRLARGGASRKELAVAYECHPNTIYYILSGRTWRHVP